MTLCEVLVSRSGTKVRTRRDRVCVIFCRFYEHRWHNLMDYALERGKYTLEISLLQIICYCRLIIDRFHCN